MPRVTLFPGAISSCFLTVDNLPYKEIWPFRKIVGARCCVYRQMTIGIRLAAPTRCPPTKDDDMATTLQARARTTSLTPAQQSRCRLVTITTLSTNGATVIRLSHITKSESAAVIRGGESNSRDMRDDYIRNADGTRRFPRSTGDWLDTMAGTIAVVVNRFHGATTVTAAIAEDADTDHGEPYHADAYLDDRNRG